MARACTFSRALCRLRVITSSFDWFTGLSPTFLIGQSNYFGFGFTTLIENCSISTFLIWQGCGSSSKMTLVGTALNLGEKLKIHLQVLTSFIKPQIWLFHVVVLLTTAKKWTKVKNARAEHANLLFLHSKYANLRHSRCRRRCRC